MHRPREWENVINEIEPFGVRCLVSAFFFSYFFFLFLLLYFGYSVYALTLVAKIVSIRTKNINYIWMSFYIYCAWKRYVLFYVFLCMFILPFWVGKMAFLVPPKIRYFLRLWDKFPYTIRMKYIICTLYTFWRRKSTKKKVKPNERDKNAVKSDNSIWKLRQDESQQSMTVAFPFAVNSETRGKRAAAQTCQFQNFTKLISTHGVMGECKSFQRLCAWDIFFFKRLNIVKQTKATTLMVWEVNRQNLVPSNSSF